MSRAGKPVTTTKVKPHVVDKNGKELPECVAPGHMKLNGTPVMCSSLGCWIVDQGGIGFLRKIEKRRAQLLYDLGHLKLSHEELMQVDSMLNVVPNQPFFPCEKYAEMYDLLMKQLRLQGARTMFYAPLSTAKGAYNSSLQEEDSRRAVEKLIAVLQERGGI